MNPSASANSQQPHDKRAQAAVALTSWTGLRPRGADERANPSSGFEYASALKLAVHARDCVRIDAEIACELPNRRQLVTSTEASCGNRRSQPPLQLDVNGSAVTQVDANLHVN